MPSLMTQGVFVRVVENLTTFGGSVIRAGSILKVDKIFDDGDILVVKAGLSGRVVVKEKDMCKLEEISAEDYSRLEAEERETKERARMDAEDKEERARMEAVRLEAEERETKERARMDAEDKEERARMEAVRQEAEERARQEAEGARKKAYDNQKMAEEQMNYAEMLTEELERELAAAKQFRQEAEIAVTKAREDAQRLQQCVVDSKWNEEVSDQSLIRRATVSSAMQSQQLCDSPVVNHMDRRVRGWMQWQMPDGTFQNYEQHATIKIRAWQLALGDNDFQSELQVINEGHEIRIRVARKGHLEQQVVRGSGRWRPVRWVSVDDEHQEPSWTPQVDTSAFIEVSAQTSDYVKVVNLAFREAILKEKLTLMRVERVQNTLLKLAYEAAKKQIIIKRGAIHVGERMLFHGTGKSDPYTVAGSAEGFMMEHAKGNCFYGKGFYFAERLEYSLTGRYPHKACSHDGVQYAQVLLCSVLCGNSRCFGTDVDFKLDRKTLPVSDYDSANGGPHRPTKQGQDNDGFHASIIHVVYNSAQIYPEFVLTVRKRRDGEPAIEAPDLAG